MAPRVNAWTEERLARLVELKDLNQKDIWLELKKLPGPTLSKGAVDGRYRRTFGSKKPKTILTEAEKVAARETHHQNWNELRRERRAEAKRLQLGVGAQVQAINRRSRNTPETATTGPVARGTTTFEDLRMFSDVDTNQCRFIEGDTAVPLYCGMVTPLGAPYCAHHHKIAHGRQIVITEADRARRKAQMVKFKFRSSHVGSAAEVA
jgi:hypothetical protein